MAIGRPGLSMALLRPLRLAALLVAAAPLGLGALACGSGGDPGAAAAVRWSVAVDRVDPSCLRPGEELRLSVVALDGRGQPIADPAHAVTADPAGALVSLGGGRLEVVGEGPLELTVSYTGEVAQGAVLAPVVIPVVRDGTPPTIVVDSPVRGAALTGSGIDPSVPVVGTVRDEASGVASISVGDQSAAVDGSRLVEAFDVDVPARQGTNLLRIRATDRCQNEAWHSQGFLHSQRYLDATTSVEPGGRMAAVHGQRLQQEVIDDFDPDDRDDLSSLTEAALETLVPVGLQQLRGRTLTSGSLLNCSYSAVIPANATTGIGGVSVEMELEEGRTRHSVAIQDLRIPVRYRYVCSGPLGVDLSGTFVHSAERLATTVRLGYGVRSDGDPVVSVGSVSTSVSGLGVDSSSNPTLAAAVDFAIGAAESVFADELESALASVLRDVFASLMDGLLNGLADRVATPISLPPPFDLTLEVAADWDSIAAGPGGLSQSLGQYVHPTAFGTPYAPVGAITAETAVGSLDARPGPLSLAISDDGLNQILWATWFGGGLEIPELGEAAAVLAGEDADLSGLTLGISALLPPVVARTGEDDALVLGLADLRIDASLDRAANEAVPGTGVLSITGYASLEMVASARLDFLEEALRVEGGLELADFAFHLDSLTASGVPVTEPALRSAVAAYLDATVPEVMNGLLTRLLASAWRPPLELPLPAAIFGPGRSILLDPIVLERQAQRLALDIDPDDPANVVPTLTNWDEIGAAATLAARQEASAWLGSAAVGGCRVERSRVSGTSVLGSAAAMGDALKSAVRSAGAPDYVARQWNRAFKSAWDEWSSTVSLRDLAWYPAFAADETIFVPRLADANTPSLLGALEASGRPALGAVELKARLLQLLNNVVSQPGADAAMQAFADEIAERMDLQLSTSTLSNVRAAAVYAPQGLDPNDPRTWLGHPTEGALQGSCFDGEVLGDAFLP